MHDQDRADALKARLVRAFYDLAEQQARHRDGTGTPPDDSARAELDRVTQLLRQEGALGNGQALLDGLKTAEAYLEKTRAKSLKSV